MGTLFINASALLLHWSPFASRREFEGLLRFTIHAGDVTTERVVEDIMGRYCQSFFLLGVREAEQGDSVEFSYQVRLLDPSYQKDIVTAFRKEGQFSDVVLLMQRKTVEL